MTARRRTAAEAGKTTAEIMRQNAPPMTADEWAILSRRPLPMVRTINSARVWGGAVPYGGWQKPSLSQIEGDTRRDR